MQRNRIERKEADLKSKKVHTICATKNTTFTHLPPLQNSISLPTFPFFIPFKTVDSYPPLLQGLFWTILSYTVLFNPSKDNMHIYNSSTKLLYIKTSTTLSYLHTFTRFLPVTPRHGIHILIHTATLNCSCRTHTCTTTLQNSTQQQTHHITIFCDHILWYIWPLCTCWSKIQTPAPLSLD